MSTKFKYQGEESQLKSEFSLGGALSIGVIALIVAPIAQAQTPITNVAVIETMVGLEVILESDQGITPQVSERIEGNRLILEIQDAQLSPDADQFLSVNPIPGVQEITVTQQPGNVVQITLTGESAPPFAEVMSSVLGIAIQVTPNDPTVETLELVVTATRTEAESAEVPRSVTVINRDEIERQADVTRDLGEILGKFVPGFSPPTQTTSSFGQTLRGRNISVLIDGVPQSTNRNALRDLRTIDPSVIERIEVVRGSSAIYGDGATGGIVNIITRDGAEDELVSRSTVGLDFSTTNPDDSFGYTLQHSVSGTRDRVNYIGTAAITTNGGFFDAEGDRVPPDPLGQGGLADLTTINLYGKLGYKISEQQNIRFSFNHFYDSQNTDFALDPTPSGDKAEAREGLVLPDQPDTENTVLNLAYTNESILGSEVNGQIYYRNYSTRFYPFDDDFGTFGNEVLQSEVESEKIGGRLDIETPILPEDRLNVLWGVDYFYEDSAQPADLFDEPTFEASNGLVFDPTGEGFLSPPLEQNNLGLFAQLTWDVTDNLAVNGGVRQEFIGVSLDDFTTLAGNSVTGGDLEYDATLFNIGAVYGVTENFNLFGSFSQGFSIADVARALRTAPGGLSVEDLRPEAQKVDNYELGVRGEWENVQASIAGFYSYSDLGTTFDATFDTVRDPQRIYGVEADVRTQITNSVAFGGTFTYTEGDRDTDNDDDFETPLPTFQIPPIKLTGYVEYEPISGWFNRFQVLYSGSRDPEGTGFGLEEVDSYVTADLISRYDTGFGTIQLSLENLFNEQYSPIISQVYGGSFRYAARGRTLSLSYSVDW